MASHAFALSKGHHSGLNATQPNRRPGKTLMFGSRTCKFRQTCRDEHLNRKPRSTSIFNDNWQAEFVQGQPSKVLANDPMAVEDVQEVPEQKAPREKKAKETPTKKSRAFFLFPIFALVLAGGLGAGISSLCARDSNMAAAEIGPGKRLVDVAISNIAEFAINMAVVTQHASTAINRHILDRFPVGTTLDLSESDGPVSLFAARQTPDHKEFARGSWEGVYRFRDKILESIPTHPSGNSYVLLSSGQSVTHLEYSQIYDFAEVTNAGIVVVTHSVSKAAAPQLGILRVAPNSSRVVGFVEKPTVASRVFSDPLFSGPFSTPQEPLEGSMGVYLIRKDIFKTLTQDAAQVQIRGPYRHLQPLVSIGGDVIPLALREGIAVHAFHHSGFWKEVQDLADLHRVLLDQTLLEPPFSFVENVRVPTRHGPALPPARVDDVQLSRTLLADGADITGSILRRVTVGENVFVMSSLIEDTVIESCPRSYTPADRIAAAATGKPLPGIGSGTIIRGAIIGRCASIGRGVRIENLSGVRFLDRSDLGYMVVDGVVVILENAIIPDGSIIPALPAPTEAGDIKPFSSAVIAVEA